MLAATCQLLLETGLGGVTVDAVSERAGVAKAAIYRHWRTRSALLLEACLKLGSRRDAPDTGSLRVDLLVLATDLASRLQAASWAAVLPSIIDAAERDKKLAGMHARMHAEFVGTFRSVIERAQAQAELSQDEDPTDVVAAIVGPLFYRRWFSREVLDERFVRNVVDNVLASNRRR